MRTEFKNNLQVNSNNVSVLNLDREKRTLLRLLGLQEQLADALGTVHLNRGEEPHCRLSRAPWNTRERSGRLCTHQPRVVYPKPACFHAPSAALPAWTLADVLDGSFAMLFRRAISLSAVPFPSAPANALALDLPGGRTVPGRVFARAQEVAWGIQTRHVRCSL